MMNENYYHSLIVHHLCIAHCICTIGTHRQCYSNCLELCLRHHLVSIALPCISTGIFAYPSLEAADIALATVRKWLLTDDHHGNMERVVFVTRRLKDEEVYAMLMLQYFPVPDT